MERPIRSAPSGWIYHVLNRANARMPIFTKDEDFIAFEMVLGEAVARTGTRLLSDCLMGNHWHLVALEQSLSLVLRNGGRKRTSLGMAPASKRRLAGTCEFTANGG